MNCLRQNDDEKICHYLESLLVHITSAMRMIYRGYYSRLGNESSLGLEENISILLLTFWLVKITLAGYYMMIVDELWVYKRELLRRERNSTTEGLSSKRFLVSRVNERAAPLPRGTNCSLFPFSGIIPLVTVFPFQPPALRFPLFSTSSKIVSTSCQLIEFSSSNSTIARITIKMYVRLCDNQEPHKKGLQGYIKWPEQSFMKVSCYGRAWNWAPTNSLHYSKECLWERSYTTGHSVDLFQNYHTIGLAHPGPKPRG